MTNKPGSDRSRHPATHSRLEVVKPMTNTHDGETRTPKQIAELFAIAGREIEAIEQLKTRPPDVEELQAALASGAEIGFRKIPNTHDRRSATLVELHQPRHGAPLRRRRAMA